MNNHVQDRLRAQLDAATRSAPPEPALGDVLDQCGHDLTRHRRRLTGVSVGVLAAGIVLAVVAPTIAGNVLRSDEVATDPIGKMPTIDEAMTRSAEEAIEPRGWSTSTVEALDANDTVLQDDDRSQASRWLGIFNEGPDDELRIIAIDEEQLTYRDTLNDCQTRLGLRHATSCETTQTEDGAMQTIERGARPDVEGWPVDRLPTGRVDNLGDNTWLMQQVIYRGEKGLTVYVYEVVQASSWDQARREWRLDRSHLTDIAETVYAAALNDPALQP